MKVIHLLRKPLSEGTVASNTLKHGVGGLNIDTSRISSAGDHMRPFQPTNNDREVYGAQTGFQPTNHKGGRWPANLILQHLDGCKCEGIKKVKGITGGTLSGTTALGIMNDDGWEPKGVPDIRPWVMDGKETVANWVCVEGCPVKTLDEQSGNLLPQGSQKKLDTAANSFLGTGYGGSEKSTYYGDTGGASRFFKQVGGSKE